jgi:hypothetical protein
MAMLPMMIMTVVMFMTTTITTTTTTAITPTTTAKGTGKIGHYDCIRRLCLLLGVRGGKYGLNFCIAKGDCWEIKLFWSVFSIFRLFWRKPLFHRHHDNCPER